MEATPQTKQEIIELKQEKEYELLNKIHKEKEEKVKEIVISFFDKLLSCKEIILNGSIQGLRENYKDIVDNYEQAVLNLEKEVENINPESEIEVKRIKQKLIDTQALVESDERISSNYDFYIEKLHHLLEKLKIKDMQTSSFSFIISKKIGLLNWKHNNSNIAVSVSGGSSYKTFVSEELFDGELTFSIQLTQINSSYVNSYWNYCFGLIKEEKSSEQDGYYNNSCLLQSNGYLNEKFSGGSGTVLKTSQWKKDDIITVIRDVENKVYFSINNQTPIECFADIVGEMRVVVGLASSMVNDEFVIIECIKGSI